MSTEICFAKYIAHRSNGVFKKWNIKNITPDTDCIKNTLDEICKLTRFISDKEITAIINPGFISVPYMVELMDCLYLPSQLLISISSIEHLKSILRNANNCGIECYAEVGYDCSVPNNLVCWIKFLKLPPQYINLLNELKVENIICCCVNSDNSLGENIAKGYETDCIKPESIIFVFVSETYGSGKDHDIISRLCNDYDCKKLSKNIITIHDWECGMIDPEMFLSNSVLKKHVFKVDDTVKLYELSWYLTKKFIEKNNIPIKGYFLNQYFINNPLFEVHNGYISFSFWQYNTDAIKFLYKLFLKTENIDTSKLNPLSEFQFIGTGKYNAPLFSQIKSIYIKNIEDEVINNRPAIYPSYKMVSYSEFLEILKLV